MDYHEGIGNIEEFWYLKQVQILIVNGFPGLRKQICYSQLLKSKNDCYVFAGTASYNIILALNTFCFNSYPHGK